MGNSGELKGGRAIPITGPVLTLLIALSSTSAPAQMMDGGRRESMGGNRAMEVGIGLGLAIGGALQQHQKDNPPTKGPADTAKNPPKTKQDISQQKKQQKDTPPSGKPAAPPPSQARQPPQPPANPETPTAKQADSSPDPKLASPCPDCADIAARVARLVKQIDADIDKINEIARERDIHLEELKGHERSLAEVVEPQDKRYYAKMASLSRDWIRTHDDMLKQMKAKLTEQRDFLKREQARLKECIDKNCPKVSAGPPADPPVAKPPEPVRQAHPPMGTPPNTPVTNVPPTTQTPPATPPGSPPTTTSAPPTGAPPTTGGGPPKNPDIDITKLTPPVGPGVAPHPPSDTVLITEVRKTIPGSTCGPDVTDNVLEMMRRIKTDFDALKRSNAAAAEKACSNLTGTSGPEAWDIRGLDPGTSPQKEHKVHQDGLAYTDGGGVLKFYPWFTEISNACAIPRPQCAATVEFMGTCIHAQELNYIQWGGMKKLCGGGAGFDLAATGNQWIKWKSAPMQKEEDAIAGIGEDYIEALGKNPEPDISDIKGKWRNRYGNINMPVGSEYDCQLGCVLTEAMKKKIKEQVSGYRWIGIPGHEHFK